MKITVEQEDMVKELKQIELREKKAKSGILEAATNETTEQNRLGREPEVQQYTETRYRTVERHRFSPARLFGSSTYEEAYTATVTDTSARDQWQRNKRQIQDKYAKITDELQQESIELRIRKSSLRPRLFSIRICWPDCRRSCCRWTKTSDASRLNMRRSC